MLIGALAQYFFGFTIFVLSLFLVLLVLVQRGRGGGLTGALGGPGGQSAFGTKAGDLFTRITIGVATAWILLCATAVFVLRGRALPETGGVDRPSIKADANTGAGSTDASSSSSGTTGAAESISALPKIDLPGATGGAAVTPAAGSATTEVPSGPVVATPATATPAVDASATLEVPAPVAADAPADPK